MFKSLPLLRRSAILCLIYAGVASLAFWFAYELRFRFDEGFLTAESEGFLSHQRPLALLWVIPLKLALLVLAGQFRGIFYYFRLHDAVRATLALVAAMVVMLVVGHFSGGPSAHNIYGLPRGVILIDFNLALISYVGFRVLVRAFHERNLNVSSRVSGPVKRIAIIGAGRTGEQIAAELLTRRGHGLQLVCFLDDETVKHGLQIHGVPVVGAPTMLGELASKHAIAEIILALPAQSAKRIREVSHEAARLGLDVRVVPSMSDLARGQVRATDLRPVSVEDLLGRPPAQLDDAAIGAMIRGRTVLVTGAGGSIGQEICRQVASRSPARLLILERCEVLLYQIEQELVASGHGALVTPIVGDVTDADRMRGVFERFRPALVLHAAAHKHVPLMESQPGEALRNNTLGTAVVTSLAAEFAAERFVLISSDKAINPTNVMGASKRLAELVVQAMQTRPGCATKFCAVRFGNVLGSSGSVIPAFRRQIAEGGPVTVTHPEVRRYFMTIPEAVGLVLQSATQGQGGDIMLLEMGEPLRILDVARQLIELSGFRPDIDIEIKFVGLRPGEKLVEELHLEGEQYRPTSHSRILCFTGLAPRHADLSGLLDRVRGLVPLEREACKRGIKELVPEYVPYVD